MQICVFYISNVRLLLLRYCILRTTGRAAHDYPRFLTPRSSRREKSRRCLYFFLQFCRYTQLYVIISYNHARLRSIASAIARSVYVQMAGILLRSRNHGGRIFWDYELSESGAFRNGSFRWVRRCWEYPRDFYYVICRSHMIDLELDWLRVGVRLTASFEAFDTVLKLRVKNGIREYTEG